MLQPGLARFIENLNERVRPLCEIQNLDNTVRGILRFRSLSGFHRNSFVSGEFSAEGFFNGIRSTRFEKAFFYVVLNFKGVNFSLKILLHGLILLERSINLYL